jgi:hypothetical protein
MDRVPAQSESATLSSGGGADIAAADTVSNTVIKDCCFMLNAPWAPAWRLTATYARRDIFISQHIVACGLCD